MPNNMRITKMPTSTDILFASKILAILSYMSSHRGWLSAVVFCLSLVEASAIKRNIEDMLDLPLGHTPVE